MAEITDSHCNKCVGNKRHEILHKERVTSHEDIEEVFRIDWGDTYELVKCCGCGEISLRHKSWFSEDLDDKGNPVINTNYYPPAIYRAKPRWMNELFWIFGLRNDFVSV